MDLKKRNIVLILVLCLLAGVGAFFGPKVYRAVRVYKLAEEFLTQSVQSLDVTVQTEGERTVSFRLDWQENQDKRIFTLESGGEQVYFCDGVLYLKNGKGYRFSEAIPDLMPILEKPWLLVPVFQIQHEEDQWLLSIKTEDFLPQIRNLNVTLTEAEAGIRKLYLNSWGQELGDFLGLQAAVRAERDVAAIPDSVLERIRTGAVQADQDLTQEILRLIKGWMLLHNTDPLGMEMTLQVDLLELPLNTSLTLYSTNAYEKPIRYLNKGGAGFYFTDGAACTPEGVKIGTPDPSMDVSQLPGLVYYLCFNGELSCDADTYRLELDQQGMEQVLYAIVPEAENMALNLTQGTLELRMEGDAIGSVSIHMAGRMDLVITQVDIGAAVGITFLNEPFVFEIPQSVLGALLE